MNNKNIDDLIRYRYRDKLLMFIQQNYESDFLVLNQTRIEHASIANPNRSELLNFCIELKFELSILFNFVILSSSNIKIIVNS